MTTPPSPSTPVLRFDLVVPVGREPQGFRLEAAAELPAASAVLGPSGAGKTTLLRALAALVPSTGTVEVAGRLLQDDSRSVRHPSSRTDSRSVWHRFRNDRFRSVWHLPPEERRLGYVPQHGALFPHLTVHRNLLFGHPGGATGGPDLDAVVEALELGDLLERSPRYLSGGESRRVAVGRALLSRPDLLLLDEPTAGLDPQRSRRLLTALRRVRRELGTALLVVTHRRDEALALADHVVLLERGRVVASGPARPVLARATGEPLESLLEATVVEHRPADGVTRVRLASGEPLSLPAAPDLAPGTSVVAAVAAEDVLVAAGPRPPATLSARNAVPATVEALEPAGAALMVVAGPWRALLTPEAARELALAAGDRVHLVTKTHSLRIVAG